MDDNKSVDVGHRLTTKAKLLSLTTPVKCIVDVACMRLLSAHGVYTRRGRTGQVPCAQCTDSIEIPYVLNVNNSMWYLTARMLPSTCRASCERLHDSVGCYVLPALSSAGGYHLCEVDKAV
jgi:hypothetical protein